MTQLEEVPAAGTITRLPMTGEEYLESLRDGREVWLHGERVDDVTTHPAFRNSARMIARLYDAMHDPARKDVLTVPTDTGNGGFTHPWFKVARTKDQIREGRRAIEEWARMTYGWLGRSPDYKAGFMISLAGNPGAAGRFEGNVRRWYADMQERLLFLNHALINPPTDRNLGWEGAADVNVRVVEERDEGLVISGAKVVATGSALTHHTFVGSLMPITAKEFSPIFIAPMNAPGVKLICRQSYELNAAHVGSPFDYPLSSRFDENDSIIVFDRVLVPWENVFSYEVETSNSLLVHSGSPQRAYMQGCIRLAVKFDFLVGLFIKGLEMTGTSEFRGVQTRIGELITLRNLFWTCVDSMVENAVPWPDGSMVPNPDAGAVYRVMMGQAYSRAKEIFEQDIASALIYLPGSTSDWHNAELRPYLDRYVRGSGGRSAEERVKLLKVIWDAIGSEFGGRHELYERNYAGNHEFNRLAAVMEQTATGQIDGYKAFVDSFMAEYDLDGWTVPDLVNNDDVRVVGPGRHR